MLDCTTCAACCLGDLGHVGCTLEDVARLPRTARVLTAPTFRAMAMRPSDHGLRCDALVGMPMGKALCSVYAARPEVCRTVQPQDDACRRSRARLEAMS